MKRQGKVSLPERLSKATTGQCDIQLIVSEQLQHSERASHFRLLLERFRQVFVVCLPTQHANPRLFNYVIKDFKEMLHKVLFTQEQVGIPSSPRITEFVWFQIFEQMVNNWPNLDKSQALAEVCSGRGRKTSKAAVYALSSLLRAKPDVNSEVVATYCLQVFAALEAARLERETHITQMLEAERSLLIHQTASEVSPLMIEIENRVRCRAWDLAGSQLSSLLHAYLRCARESAKASRAGRSSSFVPRRWRRARRTLEHDRITDFGTSRSRTLGSLRYHRRYKCRFDSRRVLRYSLDDYPPSEEQFRRLPSEVFQPSAPTMLQFIYKMMGCWYVYDPQHLKTSLSQVSPLISEKFSRCLGPGYPLILNFSTDLLQNPPKTVVFGNFVPPQAIPARAGDILACGPTVLDSLMASAAAPTYFPPHPVAVQDDMVPGAPERSIQLVDGGIGCNNPSRGPPLHRASLSCLPD